MNPRWLALEQKRWGTVIHCSRRTARGNFLMMIRIIYTLYAFRSARRGVGIICSGRLSAGDVPMPNR